jgi:hypothetical protein
MRICYKCKQSKDETEFYMRPGKRSNEYASSCKECTRTYFDTLGKEKNKIRVQLKSNGCTKCGYNKCMRALEFHHVNSEDKKFGLNFNSFRSRSEKSLLNEVQKCILLCSNCHKEITEKEMM